MLPQLHLQAVAILNGPMIVVDHAMVPVVARVVAVEDEAVVDLNRVDLGRAKVALVTVLRALKANAEAVLLAKTVAVEKAADVADAIAEAAGVIVVISVGEERVSAEEAIRLRLRAN